MIEQDFVTLLLSSGNGPGECRQAVARTLEKMRQNAEAANVEIDISERPAPNGPSSAVVLLSGPAADEVAGCWEGVIQWRCTSQLRPSHKRKNWFIEIFKLPAAPGQTSIKEAEVSFQTLRAGGPGGQHQNTTDSAVRAQWRSPDGQTFSVTARDERSQHRNRKIALVRLQALVDADLSEARASRTGNARLLHHQISRGMPRRIFKGPSFKEASPR